MAAHDRAFHDFTVNPVLVHVAVHGIEHVLALEQHVQKVRRVLKLLKIDLVFTKGRHVSYLYHHGGAMTGAPRYDFGPAARTPPLVHADTVPRTRCECMRSWRST